MRKPIASYKDLEVFQITYAAAIRVAREVVPRLPDHEKYDLVDQLRRSSKAIPRLIAEGYGKKHQLRGFQKYLDDALAECNETGVSLEQCCDIYGVDCKELVAIYDRAGKQLYRLAAAWTNFKSRAPLPTSPHLNPPLHPTPTSSPPTNGIIEI